MGDHDNLGVNSPAAKKLEAELREKAERLNESVTPANLTPPFKRAANKDKPSQ
jgi:hypothetical protein